MLSPEELLLMKAVQDEQANQQLQQVGAVLAGSTGALVGSELGRIPHGIGKVLNKGLDSKFPIERERIIEKAQSGKRAKTVKEIVPRGSRYGRLKPGFRMAGGLTGAILGGSLGAGMAALMKQDEAGRLLGRMQATGGVLSTQDEILLGKILSEAYSNPSQIY